MAEKLKKLRMITESELRAYDEDPEKRKRAKKHLVDRPDNAAAAAFIRKKLREGNKSTPDCETPGKKVRSAGKGRGLALGKGKGPMGIPYKTKETKEAAVKKAYSLGFELGVREKLAQGPNLTASMVGAMPQAAAPAAVQKQPVPGAEAAPPPVQLAGIDRPNWPAQMPQHGGPVTPVSQVVQQQKATPPLLPKLRSM